MRHVLVKPCRSSIENRAIVQEGDRPALRVIEIDFDRAAAQPGDLPQRAREGRGGDAAAAVRPVDEEAGDPPARQRRQPLATDAPVLDPQHHLHRPGQSAIPPPA